MADSFGLKIGLEGEKEFKKALAEINQSFKVLGSEMKLVSSQFDKNDRSVQSLAARNTVLNKEIEAQKQKIEMLRQALANAAESFGENDRRTQAWQIQLNNAEAALNGMQSGDGLFNPEAFTAKPVITLRGNGSLTLTLQNAGYNKTWNFSGITEGITCDSEQMNFYYGTALLNDKVVGDGFPKLSPGETVLTVSGNVSEIIVTLRWCCI